jgi:lipoprotein-releasing system permease protein
MFRPASIFIGLRYARAKSRSQFISLISFISIFGIALGVSVLITVLSVVNGFDREIKKQIFDMMSPITVSSEMGQIDQWQPLEAMIKTNPNVKGVAPFISEQAMLTNADFTMPAMLIGILPEEENNVSALSQKMIQGHLTDLHAGQFGIVIGKNLADKLNVTIGDKIIIATMQGPFSTSSITPRFKKFTVEGIFRAGGGGLSFDSRMAFIHLHDAQQLLLLDSAISGLHVRVDNIYSAPAIAKTLMNQLPPTLNVWDWTNQLGDFFENIRMTKTMMFFIFVLIITVATFNLICTMVMVVKNKETDVAILRTLGATPAMIIMIFTIQGLLIALGGTLLGILGGVSLSLNIPALSTWIQDALHTELVSSNVYFVNYLPSDLQWNDVWFISLIALILSLVSSLYPAWKASRIILVEALNSD